MSSDTRFVILLGGDLRVTEHVVRACKSARVIAADSGIVHASSLNLEPELWVGDFDSTPPEFVEQYKHVEKLTFGRQKDETDGSLALKAAVERGAKTIILLGAMGGERTDHMLALMLEMLALHAKGIEIYMSSGDEECWPLQNGEIELDLPDGALFSILPLSDLSGLSIKGAQYPLENVQVSFGSSYTMSNVAAGSQNGSGRVHMSLTAGRSVVITRPNDFSGI